MKKLKAKISFIIRLFIEFAPAVVVGNAAWHVGAQWAILAAIGAEMIWLFLIVFLGAVRERIAQKSGDNGTGTDKESVAD
jgi:hypothetical protein